jgi:hypothetical protein
MGFVTAHRLLSQNLQFKSCMLGDVKQTRALSHLLEKSAPLSN